MMQFIAPYGGTLVDLMASPARVAELKAQGVNFPSWDLTPQQQADLELLTNGAYSPLRGYMARADYERVCAEMRLTDGTWWPIPITLEVNEATASRLSAGGLLALRDQEGVMLAVLRVEDVWRPSDAGAVCVGGQVEGVEPLAHHAFKALRHSPAELRAQFAKLSWRQVLAFHTRAPLHQAQQRLSLHAAREAGANLLLHPLIEEDEDYYYRVRCYRGALDYFPAQTTLLSLLSLARRDGGIRELMLHAIVRQNYGCTHMAWEDRREAGEDGDSSYKVTPQEIQSCVQQSGAALAIRLMPCVPWVYVESLADQRTVTSVAAGDGVRDIPPSELKRRLDAGLELPEWYSYPEVVAELRRHYPARSGQGFALFFTGLSGAGKSTIAKAVLAKLLELGGRSVTLLDGDVVRKHLSSELGFSREHRDLNIRRIGYVASEITKNHGIAICAPIAPYAAVRREVRAMVSRYGVFIEVYVATALEVCEARDRKGLYAKARAGLIKEFTGISDPYEAPEHPELCIDTQDLGVEEAAQRVFLYLEQQGFIS